MADKLKVVWFNGLSIDKIHFEQQERYIERNINTKTIHLFNALYGIIDLEFDKEMLEFGRIALKKVSGIARDGSIFDAPMQDILPEPLELDFNTLNSPIIVLKTSLTNEALADVALNNDLELKYKTIRSIIASKVYDGNNEFKDFEEDEDIKNSTFAQDKMNIALASLRLKLGVLGNANANELEIPICKIKNISAHKKIELDENFIPTCLNLNKINIVKSFLNQILYTINQHKITFKNVFKGIDKTKNTLDFSTYLTLNLLKKWYLIFSYINNKEKIHPEFLYEKLIEFQGELYALSNEEELEFIAYNHDDLSSTFILLINHIRVLFSKITSPKYSIAKLVNNGNGFYDLLFDNDSILEQAELYLAVHSSVGYEYLLRNFKTQSKIYTQSKIKEIVATQLKGLNIEQIPNIPSNIPYLNGYIYYKLDKEDKLFKDFKGENVISIYLTNNIKEADIKMWALF
ncbi:type VI secretion system, baseplate protein [Campylobacter novaezeelandiae]|uniref:type VI secretion system baseplate subunit TssK n=1 Tax=Campylobacter novaezeelandiae TaxID=2267891 RepID=UPI001C1E46FB|nr:type VI secretion system baseplate subunit TssK [Campylobacter novaezeelandiae]QWU79598.1 type VI secretion system, baseplate protein [Campylobacter novaezeelandiae]QWU79601.1 type VI secretion system, baseplate protein [Campylobacter novaezeelandiae]